MNWYCITNDIQRGPMTLEAMRALIASGTLSPDDYVWTPDFGQEWREAGNVDALFPHLAAPVTPPPLVGATESEPRVLPAFASARNRMFALLFQPFLLGTWIKYLFFIMMARMNPLPNFVNVSQPVDAGAAASDPVTSAQLLEKVTHELTKVAQALAGQWDAFVAASFTQQLLNGAGYCLLLVLSIFFSLYICSWGVFLLLHSWHNPRARLHEAFLFSRAFVPGLLKWKCLYTVPLVAVILAGAAMLFARLVLPYGRTLELPPDWREIVRLASGLITIPFIALMVINFVVDQFVAPMVYWRDADVRRGLRLWVRCVCAYPLAFVRFILVYVLFMVLAGIVAVVVLSAGGGGAPSLFKLIVLQVALIPLFLLLRGFSLFYLVQWRPDLTHDDPPPTETETN